MAPTSEIRPRSASQERQPRRRLPAPVRIAQILDAALQVFSDKGYALTRIDDIGEVAQLSKGGIYTHFRSKEEIFEALLTRMLEPVQSRIAPWPLTARVTVDVLVDRLIAPMYALFADPSTLRTLRLLFADGAQVPQMVKRWREVVVEPNYEEVQRLIERGIAQGALRDSVVARAPRLLLSPGVHSLLELMIQGPPSAEHWAEGRRHHIALLRELLEP